jgi:hypothetical protein
VTAALTRLPRGPGPAPVAEVAQRLLDWIVGWWDDHAEEVTPLPERRYLAPGAPREVAWDLQTGQLTVALERLVTALDPGAPPASARSPRQHPANTGRINRTAALEVQIVRCIPVPDLGVPTADQLADQGAVLTADAGHLLSAVVEAVRTGALLREHVGQGGVQIGDALTLGPMGGAAGVALPVAVPLL